MSELLIEFDIELDREYYKLHSMISDYFNYHEIIIVDGIGFFTVTIIGDCITLDCFKIISSEFINLILKEIETVKQIRSIKNYAGLEEDLIFLNLVNGENSNIDFISELSTIIPNIINNNKDTLLLCYSIEVNIDNDYFSTGNNILSGFHRIEMEYQKDLYLFNFYNSFMDKIANSLDFFINDHIINLYSNSNEKQIKENLYSICKEKIFHYKIVSYSANDPF